MEKVALITGASGGIGLELARLFAKDKKNLLLVARNESKLAAVKQELEKDHLVKVFILAADLSIIEGFYSIQEFVKEHNILVEYLVNNAGFGDYGAFTERSIEKYREMLGLNINALTELTHSYAMEMVERGSGKILNVASVAGLQPDPYFGVYGATKAYIISLTEALHKELENTGVTATVLSPGVTETGFMERADMSKAKIYKSGVMNAKDVALVGYRGMMRGTLHVIPGVKNKVLGFLSSTLPPSNLRLAISAKIMEESRD